MGKNKKEKKRRARRAHRPYRIIFLILSLCLWLGVIEINGERVSEIYHYYTASFDSTTTGIIVTNKRVHGYRGTRPVIRYKYKAGGKIYRSYNLSFGGAHEKPAEKKYPVGRKVTVHYDSANPDASTLYVDKISDNLWMMVLLIIFMASITAWAFYPKKLVKKWLLKRE